MSLLEVLFGSPLASSDEPSEKIGIAAGVPIFGLDALGSVAYGPEAALTILMPLGVTGIHYIIPLSGAIIFLLGVVYFSYRQTIAAYPGGGGSYIVATQNLGSVAGLLAGTALLIDYVLVVAVGIAAGVGALVSAIPALQAHTLGLCLAILTLISVVNLRGLRTTGTVFMLPTFLFIGCLLGTLLFGLCASFAAAGHPIPVIPPPKMQPATEAAGAWLLLRSFASGCTAMTGVEAVSNGVMAFREPAVKNAQRTLSVIIAILVLLLAGVAYLCSPYQIGATIPGGRGYQSLLSQITAAVVGRNWFYYVTMGSILTVLVLQANTAFADFPRVCRAIAVNRFLPTSFLSRGRRLVYSQGIYLLTLFSAVLLIAFRGVTDRLIPLFAVGAFLAFTLSQAGMVAHWKRVRGAHAKHSMLINGIGALATATPVVIVIVSKFVEGAWITLITIPGILLVMRAVRRYYVRVDRELVDSAPLQLNGLSSPLVIVPIEDWNKVAQKALRFALTLSPYVLALQVRSSDEPHDLEEQWSTLVQEPARREGLPVPALKILKSPYRMFVHPMVDYIVQLERECSNRQIAVVVPQLVEKHWYEYFLHSQRSELMAAMLLLRDHYRISIVSVPWHLQV